MILQLLRRLFRPATYSDQMRGRTWDGKITGYPTMDAARRAHLTVVK